MVNRLFTLTSFFFSFFFSKNVKAFTQGVVAIIFPLPSPDSHSLTN